MTPQTLEGIDLGSLFEYDNENKVCKMVRKLEYFVYFYPVIEEESGNLTYELGAAYYLPNQKDTTLSNDGSNFLEIKVNFVDLTRDDELASTKKTSSIFPTYLGSIFAPLFD